MFVHLDDVDPDDLDTSRTTNVYAFDHEDRESEVLDTVQSLRGQYAFAVGFVFPDVVEEYMPLDDGTLEELTWRMVLYDGDIDREMMESLTDDTVHLST